MTWRKNGCRRSIACSVCRQIILVVLLLSPALSSAEPGLVLCQGESEDTWSPDPIPAPWKCLAGLTPGEAEQIKNIHRRMTAEMQAAEARIIAERTPIVNRINPELLDRDLDYSRKMLYRRTAQREEMEIDRVLTSTSREKMAKILRVASVRDFPTDKPAIQQAQNWCWAAAIQGLFWTRKIEMSQPTIVAAIHDQHLKDEQAGGKEIIEGLGQWSLRMSNRLASWLAGGQYFPLDDGFEDPKKHLLREIKDNRPVMLGLDREHIVVLYKMTYRQDNKRLVTKPGQLFPEFEPGLIIESLTWFDPFPPGTVVTKAYADALDRITDVWFMHVEVGSQRVF